MTVRQICFSAARRRALFPEPAAEQTFVSWDFSADVSVVALRLATSRLQTATAAARSCGGVAGDVAVVAAPVLEDVVDRALLRVL